MLSKKKKERKIGEEQTTVKEGREEDAASQNRR